MEVKTRFGGLQLEDKEPDEVWNDIRDIVEKHCRKNVVKTQKPRGRTSPNGYQMKQWKSQINEERLEIKVTMTNIDD